MQMPFSSSNNSSNSNRNYAAQLKLWLFDNKLNRSLLIVCLISLICFYLLLAAFASAHQNQQHNLLDLYGNTINNMAASQTTVSMGNNNLIGLQSLLNDLVKYERVINAIIYDVDNKIIVQAGEINSSTHTDKAYTTPITLDDTLLGSITISLDTTTVDQNQFILLLVLLAALPTLACLYFFNKKIKTGSIATSTLPQEQPPETLQSHTKKPASQALLVLHIHTLEKLFQQLNAEARQQQFDQLRLAIKKVLTLYSGQQVATTANSIVLSFEDSDQTVSLFNALCSAHLLQENSEQQHWLINFSAILYNKSDSLDAVNELPKLRQLLNNTKQPGELLIKSDTVDNIVLTERLHLQPSAYDGFTTVSGFTDNYKNLLDSQLAHLLKRR